MPLRRRRAGRTRTWRSDGVTLLLAPLALKCIELRHGRARDGHSAAAIRSGVFAIAVDLARDVLELPFDGLLERTTIGGKRSLVGRELRGRRGLARRCDARRRSSGRRAIVGARRSCRRHVRCAGRARSRHGRCVRLHRRWRRRAVRCAARGRRRGRLVRRAHREKERCPGNERECSRSEGSIACLHHDSVREVTAEDPCAALRSIASSPPRSDPGFAVTQRGEVRSRRCADPARAPTVSRRQKAASRETREERRALDQTTRGAPQGPT